MLHPNALKAFMLVTTASNVKQHLPELALECLKHAHKHGDVLPAQRLYQNALVWNKALAKRIKAYFKQATNHDLVVSGANWYLRDQWGKNWTMKSPEKDFR